MLKIQIAATMVKEGKKSKLTDSSAVHKECKEMAVLAQEAVVVLTMNAKNRMIGKHLISLGLADQSLIHPREVFRSAILDGATAVILVHNHPTGDVTPSAEDLKVTRGMIDAGKIMGIHVMDHVIIGREETPFKSLRESGMVSFE